ncbi:NACHT, LRR and PYD domains-containing protein 12-like isoform X2 [Rana temporaria]|uniref:NACHT, LRR and PYD domains-containing protein 12-like isoform X2 n=1 Tax=Rana temporaria TaxID=8407 RepID=UPI001AAC876E|nr:NACHT, LRR and PYD domains-containing protein 12-like isoform X2 [Rana temporaria]
MAERLIKEKRRVTPEDIGRFRHRLSAYDDPSLRKIYEYYRDDLTYILENMGPRTALVELKSRNVLNTEKYEPMEKDPSSFSYTLLQDIRDRGREAVIGLWECLYVLQDDDHHPNLLAVLDEITQRGEGLVDQILLDEHGHSLIPELRDIQEKHKQHLMEKTETLEEHRPPGTTLEPQRFLINERYVKLIVVSTVQFRERSRNELIQTGVKHEECLKETQTRLEHISSNKLFRWNPQSHSVPRAVMVSGVPGIGKTTLMQKFVYDWVTGKHYQRFAFLFFFRFRELNRLGEVSLEEMILHQYPYLESQIGDILQDPERLLFIFDGLDESLHQINFTSSKLSNPKQRSHFGEIVVSLVRQSLLKGCSVLMTSRPTRLASVNTDVFQRIAEIMGFLHGDRQIFFNNFFGNEELSEKAFHYVQENDTLYTFCYIPSYCWIICTVLSMCFRSQPITDQLMTSLPKTMTQLFVTFVSNILTNHSQNKDGGHTDRELLTSIGWMAEHGVMNHMIVFDERHLESFKVRNDDHLFSSFMMETGQPPDVDYTFLHLTLQEFFAALVNLINYNSKRLQETLDTAESYKDGRGEILLRFLCGLSDSSTRSLLKSHVGELSTQAAGDVITWIQKKLPEQIPDKPIRGSRELLSVFYYLYESRNKALVSQCIGSNKGDFSKVPLSPLDCSVLSFILPSCREIEEIDLTSCNVQSEGLRKFIPALHNIKRLRLEDNHLTDSSSPHLASGIRNNRTLRTLNLSVNNLEGPHFRDLMEALTTSRIKELQLSSNQLTDSSSPHLASGIRNNRTLRTLDLSRNNLEGPHFRDLMESLATSRIEELQLDGNRLTDSSSPHLTSGIRNNQTLRTLNLSWNNLEGPHFRDLMESLTTSRIEELQLWDNHLTDSFCPHLTSGIRNNQTLRTLNLSKNNLEGPHFRDLMESLTTSRIEELQLIYCHLTDSSCPHLASGIRNNQTLRTLDLSGNNLEGPHFRDLMEALTTSQIDELQLEDNHLTDSSSSHLASGIRNNQTLRTLDLSGNNLEGPHFRDLMESLATSRIEELQVYRREYRHLLAFIFAIDEINRSPDILPNITLGYHVYDSCGHVNKAIKDVLQILSGHTKEAPNYSCMERGALAGFIGDLNSDTTLQMAQLLNLYGYTQISYGARDTLLSDRKMYPNFFRTVPDDEMQYVAIAKLLERLKWNWVGILTSDDEYGEREFRHLSKHLSDHGICIEFKILVSKENCDKIPPELRSSTTEVLIICGSVSLYYYKFLYHNVPYYTEKTFIIPDSWSMSEIFFILSNCSLVFTFPHLYIKGLLEYFYNIYPSSCPNDPLMEDILIAQCGCFSKNQIKNFLIPLTTRCPLRNCSLEKLRLDLYYIDEKTSYRVYISVYILAQALHDMDFSFKINNKKSEINPHTLKYKVRASNESLLVSFYTRSVQAWNTMCRDKDYTQFRFMFSLEVFNPFTSGAVFKIFVNLAPCSY